MKLEELVDLVVEYINCTDLTVEQKINIYKIIKSEIKNNKISKNNYIIIKGYNTKSIKIDATMLSIDALIDILNELNYEYN